MNTSKYISLILIALITVFSLAPRAMEISNKARIAAADEQVVEDLRAININFFGGFTGFDPNSFKILKTTVANLIVEGVVDHYITTGWGLEGGNSFCLELSKDPNIKMSQITNLLQVIKPTNNTVYNYSTTRSCIKEN